MRIPSPPRAPTGCDITACWLRTGLVIVDEAETLAQRQDARGRSGVAGSRAQAKPVEAGGDFVTGPRVRHAPHDAFGIRAGPVAVIASLRSCNPHLGVSSSIP